MNDLSGNHPNWIEKLRANVSNLLTAEAKDTVELLSSVLLIFMLTCIGAMLMICVFFELERRSPQSERLSDRPVLALGSFDLQTGANESSPTAIEKLW